MHHRAIHEQILKADISLSFEPKANKRVANALRAIAVYERSKTDTLERLADMIDPPEGECQ